MGHAAAQGDSLTFARADAEFHSLLLQLTGNRMLEHLSGIVSSALQVSGGSSGGCEHPVETSVGQHMRIVDAIGAGDAAGAEAAMRQLLASGGEVGAAGAGGAGDHVVPAPREH